MQTKFNESSSRSAAERSVISTVYMLFLDGVGGT